VLGTILATQEALRYFPSSGGSIINISSVASENPVPNSCLYSATRGAIDTITKALAKELGPRNIRVNAVAPGLVDTEGNRSSGFVGSAAGVAGAAVTRWPRDLASRRKSRQSLFFSPQTTRRG
jgi:3-oxoacyl-[acyl-carrier protein] reductase